MQFQNLQELLQNSSSSRSFLLSLPVSVQLKLHEADAHIHTQFALRRNAAALMRHSSAEWERESLG